MITATCHGCDQRADVSLCTIAVNNEVGIPVPETVLYCGDCSGLASINWSGDLTPLRHDYTPDGTATPVYVERAEAPANVVRPLVDAVARMRPVDRLDALQRAYRWASAAIACYLSGMSVYDEFRQDRDAMQAIVAALP